MSFNCVSHIAWWMWVICSHIIRKLLQTWWRNKNFEVISASFNTGWICTSGNYVQKWITKLYN